VTRVYLEEAFEIVYSVGVKLGFAIWMNSRKGDFVKADECANHLAYELISNERYRLAIRLLEYALSPTRKEFSEPVRRFQILNLAQAHKWMGEEAKCLTILSLHDWDANSDLLRLGNAILRNDFESAYAFVRKLSHDPEFKRESYYDWPIFKEIRKEPKFIATFEEAYGEPFSQKVVTEESGKISSQGDAAQPGEDPMPVDKEGGDTAG